jgi:hypothetical protein
LAAGGLTIPKDKRQLEDGGLIMAGDKLLSRFINSVVGHLRNARRINRIVQITLVSTGAFIAGVAQFSKIEPTGITANQLTGIFGCCLAVIGAVFMAFRESDTTGELAIAAEALEQSEIKQEEIDDITEVYRDLTMAINLISANQLMRGFLERTCFVSNDTDQSIEAMLKIAGRNISIALGFENDDEFTICVYQAAANSGGKDQLKLIAHHRAIPCDKPTARVWEEGVGVAGICYSTANEIIVPDLQADGIGGLFNISPRQRDYDASRYRSIIAVPIQVDELPRPWGVVTATSDREYHFQPDAEGLQTCEGVRTLAGMCALNVAINMGVAVATKSA